MPELPEVETLVRGLRRPLVGRRITVVRLGKTDFMDDPAALQRDVPGCRIEEVTRHGKFIVMRLSPSKASSAAAGLLVHLGMTGHLAVASADEPIVNHTHAFFALDDGRELRYTDSRRFGRMGIFGEVALQKVLAPLGHDPLEISRRDFALRLARRRARIKALLLDQRVLRGVGNIYADESLWRARIHPARLAASLTAKQVAALHVAIGEVLKQAIESRGSSISNFRDAQGQPGEYQLRHRAYGREGKPCFRCRSNIRRILVAGRSSFFCPRCQRTPRAPGSAGRSAKKKTKH
ncbi:MAG TPA: bifunctional DNA-formamidopyrimidine glycosylase/DNA-(apurinic or apyrimidinic site) lyase [Candidatus Dormibacteraeota bacterium]|nr:bifunctional DNA-formamidopyrimidine glycosylase/DNA-(apurinic or apyrimidinic site) lyase [Candidatus Dormibacteraeota bacterium]